MQKVYEKYNQFQKQSHSQRDIVRIEDLNKQMYRLQEFKLQNSQAISKLERADIQKYLKVYTLAIRQIQRMKMQFTKPSLVKERLAQIFDNQQVEMSLQNVMEKSSEIRTDQIQFPTFKKANPKQNIIDEKDNDINSPGLRHFFQKKQTQINNRSYGSNFRSILNTPQNKQLSRINQNRSASRQMSGQVSRSSASSSFKKKPTPEIQLRKVLEQNKKIKQGYEKKLKKELQLSEFQKNLLKEEKSRYMLKIQELENQLENIYRDNYRLKEEEIVLKEKYKRQKIMFDNSASFRDVDENIHGNAALPHDYYQPYVLRTKHNDLKRLNNKCHSQIDEVSLQNRSSNDFFNPQNQVQKSIFSQFKAKSPGGSPQIDFLGNQLQKQLKQIQKQRSRSNNSRRSSSKKWSKQYNAHLHDLNKNSSKGQLRNIQKDVFSALNEDQQQEERLKRQLQNNQRASRLKQQKGTSNFVKMSSQNPFQKKQDSMILKDLDFSLGHDLQIQRPSQVQINIKQPRSIPGPSSSSHLNRYPPQINYKPSPNYSFTKAANKDYSMRSNSNNYDTFQMTHTYLDLSQNEQESETNKYIDSKTSTRNKVGFFKDSLILIKNDSFEVAFKRSALVPSKDRARIIFFVKNKTSKNLSVNFHYEYDAGYFKLKVNEKLQSVPPHGQSRQDLQIYAFSNNDLNEVIDILIDVDFNKYGLWMPVVWIQFQESSNFKMPIYNEQISIIPDRQFKNYETAKTMMPLMFGGIQGFSQWAYLYGTSKFGPCYVKLTWENKQLKIQTNAKWIDLLAFIMHHVK